MKVPVGLATMNSKELNVNVPLATGESDSEEFEVFLYRRFLSIIDKQILQFAEMQSGTAPISPRPPIGAVSIEGGLDSVTGSLEDLVSTFDEKLTMCFADYQEQVDKIAPVQVCQSNIFLHMNCNTSNDRRNAAIHLKS